MPIDTVKFASDSAREMLDLRQQAEDDEAPQEAVFDSEARYIRLIDDLAVNKVILHHLPELMQLARQQADPFDDELTIQVLTHLICRTLQPDWIAQWLAVIRSSDFKHHAMNLLVYLPENLLHPLLRQAFNTGGDLKAWVLEFCVHNHASQLAQSFQITPPFQSVTEARFFSHFCPASESHVLQQIAGDSDYSPEIRCCAALGLFRFQPTAALEFFRSQSWLISPETGYGRWLSWLGEEKDLRDIEAFIETLAEQFNQKESPSLFQLIAQMTQSLIKGGDASTVRWLYQRFLTHPVERIRALGFESMLPFFSQEIQHEGMVWLVGRPVAKDESGEYPLFSVKEGRQFWSRLESHLSSQLLPAQGRCRSGKNLDQIDELHHLIDDVRYDDPDISGLVRLRTSLFTGTHHAFDELAPYDVYIRQKQALKSALDQYRKTAQYSPGNYCDYQSFQPKSI